MIMLFPHAIEKYGSLLVNLAAEACRDARVPVALHLDHVQDEKMVERTANMAFDSIMVDMSHYELEENLEKTRRLVEYCHERGIAVEAEAGRIEGGEDGLMDTGDLESILTAPALAQRFVDTGIDFLAPCIGNAHGVSVENMRPYDYERSVQPYRLPQMIRLRILTLEPRLANIFKAGAGKTPLVLHGTTTDVEVRNSIRYGVAKVNLNRQLELWNEQLKSKSDFLPVTALMDEEIDVAVKEIERLCDVCGSTGKA